MINKSFVRLSRMQKVLLLKTKIQLLKKQCYESKPRPACPAWVNLKIKTHKTIIYNE